MIRLVAGKSRNCQQVTRRNVLKIGALGGFTLADFWRLQAQGAARPQRSSQPAVIQIFLAGGPSHLETYDPKPHAPAEYRGPLGTIGTAVPGIAFSEMVPRQATVMDKIAIVRSVHHDDSRHVAGNHLVKTGHVMRGVARDSAPLEAPSLGACASKLRGPNVPGLPAYVAVTRAERYDHAAYLGKAYAPFEPRGYPNSDGFRVQNLTLPGDVDAERFAARKQLLSQLDGVRRIVDTQGTAAGMDDYQRQAFQLISGDRCRQAFNIHEEDKKLRERYGRNHFGQCLLLARRLCESGVTFTTVKDSGWDHHSDLLPKMKKMTPRIDQAITALIEDIHVRGLDRDILVVVTGEFGRTPKWDEKTNGRHHWPGVYSVLLSGGGLRMGQVIGESTKTGAIPRSDAYAPQDIHAMMYRHLGIDPGHVLHDEAGRPLPLLHQFKLVKELI